MLQDGVRPVGFALPGKRVGIVRTGQFNARLRPGKARVELGRLDHIVSIKHLPMMHFVIHREEPPAQFRNIGQFEILAVDKDRVILLRERAAVFKLPLKGRKWVQAGQGRIVKQRRLHIPAHLFVGRDGDFAFRHGDRRRRCGLRRNVGRMALRRTQGQHHCKE